MLAELLADRVVALPPVSPRSARRAAAAIADPRVCSTAGAAREPADLDAVVAAIVAISTLAVELGDRIAALDVNPLIAGPSGALAVDALVQTPQHLR